MNGASHSDIPEEIQIDILSRLPTKRLSRCKCVSKHWNDTLTIQAFLLRHSRSYDQHSKLAYASLVGYEKYVRRNSIFSYSPTNMTVTLLKTTKISLTKNSWTTTEIITEEEIIGHNIGRFTHFFLRGNMSNICNDLICHNAYFSRYVGLLNIKTQDFIHLPAVTTQSAGCNKFWNALGFDSVTNVYKVLCFYGGSQECPTKAAILTVGSKHWRPVEYKFLRCAATQKRDNHWRRNNSLCLDGVIYWIKDNEIHGDGVLTVVAFDLNNEVFTDYKIDMIRIEDDEKIRFYLTSLKGCPTLFIWKDEESDEIQQLTLFSHKNPKAAYWNIRSIIAHDFPKDFPYGRSSNCVAGGSILLQSVKPRKHSVNPVLSRYRWYDLEKLAIE